MVEPMSSARATARNATAIGLAALAIGLLAQFLFIDAGLGINVPIATALIIGAGWAVRDRSAPAPRWADAWLAPGALVLSAFVALRGDRALVALDILGALALSGAALASFGGVRVLERPAAGVVSLAGRLALSGMAAGGRPLAALVGALPRVRGSARGSQVAPIMRGLLIAAPLVILFVILFASADAVFARIAGDLLDWHLDLGSLPGRFALTIVVAWLAAGLLVFVVKGRRRRARPRGRRRRGGPAPPRLDGGGHRADRARPALRGLRGAPGHLSVRRQGHARGQRPDLRQLRPSWLLRAAGRRVRGGRPGPRPGDIRATDDARLPGRGDRAGCTDPGRARLCLPATAPLPGARTVGPSCASTSWPRSSGSRSAR